MAREAIDQSSSRFRLKGKSILHFLGDPEDEDSLFHLALKLGWLNRIGIAEENPFENVYSFLHPTFQEYFAALAIDDRCFFLNHIPHSPQKGTYRIFKQSWREVFLLWFGKTITPRDARIELINELIRFGDSCEDFFGGFYHYQAYFMAASAFGECRESLPGIEKAIIQTSELAFGFVDYGERRWIFSPDFISNTAKSSLKESNCTEAVKAIENLLELMRKDKSSGNTLNDDLVLTRMIKWMMMTGVESGLLYISSFLIELDSSNQIAINTLRRLLNCGSGLVTSGAASVLLKYGHGNVEAEISYSKALESMSNLAQTMGKLNFNHIFEEYNSDDTNHSLHELDITSLTKQLHDSYGKQGLVPIRIINQLGEVGHSDMKVIETLVHYLLNDDNPAVLDRIYKSLEKIATKDNFLQTVRILKNSLDNPAQSEKVFSQESLKLLWYCAQNVNYPDFYAVWNGLQA